MNATILYKEADGTVDYLEMQGVGGMVQVVEAARYLRQQGCYDVVVEIKKSK
jgi:hypothetical protein